VDITRFDVRAIPEIHSATKLDQKLRTADSITRWWIGVLTDGEFAYSTEDTYTRRARLAWEDESALVILKDDFYSSYRDSVGGAHVECREVVAKKVAELLRAPGLAAELKSIRARDSLNGRLNQYALPALKTAREIMDKRMGQRGPWHDTEGAET
jgi:hypothetical protein